MTIEVNPNSHLDFSINVQQVRPSINPQNDVQLLQQSINSLAQQSQNYFNRILNQVTGSLVQTQTIISASNASSSVNWFNVKDFGALGTGAGDDGPAISAAIAAATAESNYSLSITRTVYIPAGYYRIASNIILNNISDLRIIGEGRNETLLIQGTSGITIFQTSGFCTRVQIEDMWIGSFSAQAAGGGFQSINSGTPTSDLTLRRLAFQNLVDPIYFDNVAQTTIDNIYIIQSIAGATPGVAFYMIRSVSIHINDIRLLATAGAFGSDGIRIDSDCDTIIGHHCELVLMGNGVGSGINLTDSVGSGTHPNHLVRFTDCLFENAAFGVQIQYARDCSFLGCEAANNTFDGYLIAGGQSVKLMGCLSWQNQQHGYDIVGGVGVELIGCTASGNGQGLANNYSGIWTNSSGGLRLIANRCGDILLPGSSASQGYGIALEAGADYVYVAENDLQTNITEGLVYYTTGSHNIIGSNMGVTGSYTLVTDNNSNYTLGDSTLSALQLYSQITAINDVEILGSYPNYDIHIGNVAGGTGVLFIDTNIKVAPWSNGNRGHGLLITQNDNSPVLELPYSGGVIIMSGSLQGGNGANSNLLFFPGGPSGQFILQNYNKSATVFTIDNYGNTNPAGNITVFQTSSLIGPVAIGSVPLTSAEQFRVTLVASGSAWGTGVTIGPNTATNNGSTALFLNSVTGSQVPLIIRGSTLQSSILMQLQTPQGNNVFSVDPSGSLGIANYASATVGVGTISNKFPIYATTGVLLGYVPIYASIT